MHFPTARPKRDLVTIYEDPFTRRKPEGQAELVQFIGWTEPGVERHWVHFIGDPAGLNVQRIIVTDDENQLASPTRHT